MYLFWFLTIMKHAYNINTKYSNNTAVGTTVNACGGNVRPKTSKKIISKKSRAVSCETRIHVL